MLVCILGGIGTAGVPAGSLPVVALILAMVGIDPQAIALVLGVDRFLDMCRTTLNVVGDLVAAQVISAGEPPDAGEGEPLDRVTGLRLGGFRDVLLDHLVGQVAVELGQMVELRLIAGQALAQRAQLRLQPVELGSPGSAPRSGPIRSSLRADPCRASGRAGWRPPTTRGWSTRRA